MRQRKMFYMRTDLANSTNAISDIGMASPPTSRAIDIIAAMHGIAAQAHNLVLSMEAKSAFHAPCSVNIAIEITAKLKEIIRQAELTAGLAPSTQLTNGSLILSASEVSLYQRHLTSSALDIAEVIGLPLAVILVANCKGNTFVLHGKDFDFLLSLLGSDAAYKLQDWMGEVPLTIPTCKAAERAVIYERIRNEFDQLTNLHKLSARKAVRELTKMFSLHERSIWRLLKKCDEPKTRLPSKVGILVGRPRRRKKTTAKQEPQNSPREVSCTTVSAAERHIHQSANERLI